MMNGREITREEIPLIWTIDRSEVIDGIYCHENGVLVRKPEHYLLRGWSPGTAERYTPVLLDCYDRGGWFYGLFDAPKLVGITVLESELIGTPPDQLQLKFLHISHDYRGQGLGKYLFEQSRDKAREKGAQRLYISSAPAAHTVDFYCHLGCTVTQSLNPELFALEPDDIHLECPV